MRSGWRDDASKLAATTAHSPPSRTPTAAALCADVFENLKPELCSMRSFAAVLLVLAAACATGGKPGEPPSIVGSYVLTRIDNRALPTYSPTEPNVRVERGTLVLGRAGAFVLSLTARNSPQLPPEERSIRGA